MTRHFTPQDVITLPRLTAVDTLTLAQALLTEAETMSSRLPPYVSRACSRLFAQRQALEKVLMERDKAAPVDSGQTRQADNQLDRAWSCFYDWLGSWCALADEEHDNRASARALYDRVFAQRLSFLKLSYNSEWAESEARIKIIEQDNHQEIIKSLGGLPFYQHLKQSHLTYGRALNITSTAPTPSSSADLRATCDMIQATLRDYVAKVAAMVEPEDSASQTMAEQLLRPLTGWVSRSYASRNNEPALAATDASASSQPMD
jgi:hypothetical protein